jgi:hypothetical protein
MAVLSYREVLPRTFSHKFGESPVAGRNVVVTVDGPTSTQEIINWVGIFHGDSHPEYSYLRMIDSSIEETDKYHVSISYSYGVLQQDSTSWDPSPLGRADVWSFSTGGAQVPALVYYDGTTKKPLVNAAGDFFEGLTVTEAEVRCTIAGNRPSFPLALAAAVTNTVNASSYLGGDSHTWFCAGITGQQATEIVNGLEVRYWQVSAELIYRKSGHDLQLPHVGWHYVTGSGSTKFRTYVRSEDGTDIAAGTPQPLNADGSQKYTAGTSGPPDILVRQVYPETNFSTYFGVPPF